MFIHCHAFYFNNIDSKILLDWVVGQDHIHVHRRIAAGNADVRSRFGTLSFVHVNALYKNHMVFTMNE